MTNFRNAVKEHERGKPPVEVELNISTFRHNFSEILLSVLSGKCDLILKKYNHPIAKLVAL